MQHMSLARRMALATVAAAGLTFVVAAPAGAIGAKPEDPTNTPEPTDPPPPPPPPAPTPAPGTSLSFQLAL